MNNLKNLTVVNTDFADQGIEYLLQSSIINHLEHLVLDSCNITDYGAEMLAKHFITTKLNTLRLDGNLISPIGIAALAEVGVIITGYQRISPSDFNMSPDPDEAI